MSCRTFIVVATSLSFLTGCFETRAPLEYIGKEPLRFYEDQATRLDEPLVGQVSPDEVVATNSPRTLAARRDDEIWDMPLAEAIEIALQNATVIRQNATFRSSGNPLLNNPEVTPSIYDPSIQESTVFGGRGVEAALSDFDTDFTSSMTWGRDEQVQNSPFSPAGFGVVLPTVATETGNFAAGLTKDTASGGQLSLTHQMNYTGVPPGLFPFPSSYAGNVRLGYRQPLWAGAGTEFTRISGPIGTQTGLTQNLVGEGVVLARINQNVTLEDFENNVRNLVLDVENLYWDLYLQYRLYNAAVVARNSSLDLQRRLRRIVEVGGNKNDPRAVTDEVQARDQYFQSRAAAEEALGQLYTTETRLRRLLGLPVNDGRVIRPADEPITAPFEADWHQALGEALHERVELRKQKWNVKSLSLQLTAAKNLVNPRLDFVSGYNVNAFGDQLIGLGSDRDAVNSPQGLRYAYESLTQGNQTGWTLGFELSMPLGFRHAHSQVRNYELRLAKAHEVLAAQELEISHELAAAFQDVARNYLVAKSAYNRRQAAKELLDKFKRIGVFGFNAAYPDINNLKLQALISLANAERDYFTSISAYNKSLADLQFRKGTLLEFNNIFLSEGSWDPAAYELALRRAKARSHATNAEGLVHAEPAEFAVPGRVLNTSPGPAPDGQLVPVPDDVRVRDILLDGSLPAPAEGTAEDQQPKAPPSTEPVPGEEQNPFEPVEPIPSDVGEGTAKPTSFVVPPAPAPRRQEASTKGWRPTQPRPTKSRPTPERRAAASRPTQSSAVQRTAHTDAKRRERSRSGAGQVRVGSAEPVFPLFGTKPIDPTEHAEGIVITPRAE